MKIGIDIRSTLKKPTGIGQYTLGLIKGLEFLNRKDEYFLYCRKGLFSCHKKIPKIKEGNFKIINDIFNKGVYKVMKNIDIFFSPTADFLDTKDIPVVVNIHDLRFKAYPRFYDKFHIDYRDRQIKRVLQKAKKITCVSKNTKKDLINYYGGYNIDSKVEVVYPGINKNIFNNKKDTEGIKKVFKKYNIEKPYILSVSTISKMKNSSSILKAFSNFKKIKDVTHKLVFAGAISGDYSMDELISDAGVDERALRDVIFTGYSSDENLACLYKAASIFIFPSFYEGFGIPIVEAFACGVPVVTSNTSACKEIADNAAIKINPENIDELTRAIIKLSKDEILREKLKNEGIERANKFSWNKTASHILSILNEVKKGQYNENKWI